MEQLLIDVENLLNKPIGANFHEFRSIYKKVFGKEAPGCKCQGNTIYNDLKNWYIKNKTT